MPDVTIIHGDCLAFVPAEPADLVIADPPYWKVLGEAWDYEWRTREDYFVWSAQWISKAFESLRLGGSMFVFGYFRMLARLSLLLEERGFAVRQELHFDKGKRAIAGRATRRYQLWLNTSESALFVVKNSRPFIAMFLREQQKRSGLTARTINDALGVKSNGGGMWSILTADNVCGQVPTVEMWTKLQALFGFSLAYEKVAPTFVPQMGFTSIWTDIDFYARPRLHPAQKPEALIERMVSTTTRTGDLVLDLFAGSGTTGVVADRLGRRAVLVEKDAEAVKVMRTRLGIYR
jgi:adenine-specific DNA-methyltransferase